MLAASFFYFRYNTSKKVRSINIGGIKITYSKTNISYNKFLYTIKIRNKSNVDLKHISAFMTLPIKKEKDALYNNKYLTFEPIPNNNAQILKIGQELDLNMLVPFEDIKNYFNSKYFVDYNSPVANINGYCLNGKEEVPFSIVRGIWQKSRKSN